MAMKQKPEQVLRSRRKALKDFSLLSLAGVSGLSAWANGIDKNTEGLKENPREIGTTEVHGLNSTVTSKIRFAVSTYSYWHFEPTKYPIEKVIEHASDLGFDGVEILHRQMENESVAYMNKLKRMAFDRGLALPLLSIHQNFLQPDKAKRKADIEHTFNCIGMAVQMGIPCIRMNTGSWGTVKNKRQTDYYQTGIVIQLLKMDRYF